MRILCLRQLLRHQRQAHFDWQNALNQHLWEMMGMEMGAFTLFTVSPAPTFT
jgi:hypothetical protein